ncbi:MAG TPA: choice-of-anchor J domain-containing protein [Bacteroidales bacterium]|nr:choice-of-anchor J domain-containing protein [Bacteroidales bacterium]
MKKLYLILAVMLSMVYVTGTYAAASVDSLVFTSSGEFTVPMGVSEVTIEVVGAGGNGWGNGGGGGGGGGYAKGSYFVTPQTTLAVTVGTGGGGAVAGTTGVGSLISASGGANGSYVNNPEVGGGGAGGTGTGGTIVNRTGGTGGGGYWTFFGGGGAGAGGPLSDGANGGNTIVFSGNCNTPGGTGGNGGGWPAGNGGKGAGFYDAGCNNTNPAASGTNYGGGGGGGNGASGAVGNGAGGYCKISWNGSVANDFSMLAIHKPETGPNLTNSEIVKVQVANVGLNPHSNIPVSYTVNGSGLVNEIIPGPLAAGEQMEYTFAQTADLSAVQSYEIAATVSVPDDENPDNDSRTKTVVNLGGLIIMQNGTLSSCSGLFYDTGGPDNPYQPSEDLTLTIMPSTPGGKLMVHFTLFDTENNYDFLKIYDGTTISEPLIGNYSGTTLPPDVVASSSNGSGAITFRFTSDGSVQGQGWVATLDCLPPLQHDLMGVSVSGPNPELGNPTDYTVTVANVGANAEAGADYTVALYDANNVLIGTANGVNIGPGESRSFTIPWTPQIAGLTHLYGVVSLIGDLNPDNDRTPDFQVTVMPAGQADVVIGTGTEVLMAPTPINGWFGYSFSQTLYLQPEINVVNKQIFQIAYQYAGTSPNVDFTIEVWLGHTALNELTASVQLTGMTKVYDGPYVVHTGEEWSLIPIDGFFYNNTDNLIVTVIEKKQGYSSSDDQFYSTVNTLPQNLCIGAQNDQTPYDPNSLPAGNQYPNRANLKLWFGEMPSTPAVRTTPVSLDFGQVEASLGKIMNVEVMNIGGGTLELTGADISNSHYTLLDTTFPISLEMGQKHIFEVQFMPTDPGTESGSLTFLMDEAIPGSRIVQLTGVGLRFGVLREGYEGELFPPLGWKVIDNNHDGKGWLRNTGFVPTGQTAPHTGIAAASLDVYAGSPGQTGYDDWLITPKMIYQDGDVFSFWIKRVADQAGQTWRICLSTTGTDVTDFTPIDVITDPPTTYEQKIYDMSQFGLINGDRFYIAFQFNSLWCWPGVLDDVLGSVVDGHQRDLMALSFTGLPVIYQNTPINFSAEVGNYGRLTVNPADYTVDVCAFVNGVETVFGSVPGDTIDPGETITFTVPVTIPETGVYNLYEKIVYAEDEDQTNNISDLLETEVIGASKVLRNIGTFPVTNQTEYYHLYPIDFGDSRGGSLSECLYYDNELNTGGIVERLTYYTSFANSIPQRKVKVWMAQTDLDNFDAGAIPASKLTLVFDGKLDFTEGIGKINIQLTHPFVYTGSGNLVAMVYYYDGGQPYINDNSLFAYEYMEYGPNRNAYDSWFTTIDPNDMTHMAPVANYPLTSLLFETGSGLGNLTGKVLYQDNSQPVDSARVEIFNPAYPEVTATLYTNIEGDYSAPYLLAGTGMTVTISKYGYSDYVYSDVAVEPGGYLNLGNAYLVTRPHIALSGHVRTSDTEMPVANAMVKITGMDNYETTTNEEGNFIFPSIWGSTTYQMEVYYGGYQTWLQPVAVPGTDYVMDTITLLENAPAPNLVRAVEQEGNALVTWYAAGAQYPIEWRRDDGEVMGILITPGSPTIVTGTTWKYDAKVSDVSWYVYPSGYTNSTQIMITLLGLNEDGSPNPDDVLHVEENVPNQIGWNTCHLSQSVSAPNGFFAGISGYDNTVILAYDDGEGEPYVWEARSQWGNGLGAYTPLENGTSPPLRANIFVRAAGLTFGPIESKGMPLVQSHVVSLPEGESLLTCQPVERMAAGNPEMKLPAAPAQPDRSFLHYNVYRKLATDPTYTQLNINPVYDTAFIDDTWSDQSYGLYKFGVEAEYTNGVKSKMSESNILEKDMRLTVHLIVNTNTGVPGISEGAMVTLTNQNGNVNYIFHALVGSDGSVDVPNVMKGFYTLDITHVGFDNYTENDIDFDVPEITIEKTVSLNERIFDPYDPEVITEGQPPMTARFVWDQAPVFEDVESYEPFLINDIGDWKVVDQDGEPTVYPAGVTFPHSGEPASFMTFNREMTTPPLSVEYWGAYSGAQYFAAFGSAESTTSNWLISPLQNHTLPFTLSFYAKSITENYGLETFRIGFSTTGDNPSDFTFITGNESTLTYWTFYSYQIPAEAKYIAIRHNHTGFALLIDDLTLGVETDGAVPANGFSVYLDNQEVASGLSTPEYIFTGLEPGSYTAGVKGHFYTGESEMIEVPFEIPVGVPVTFHVNDDLGAPVEAANVKILYNSQEIFNALTVNGTAAFALNPGNYQYRVVKEGFDSVCNDLAVGTTALEVNVVLNHLYDMTFQIQDGNQQPIAGATIVYRGENQVTTASGSVTFLSVPGTWSYAVTHPEYNRVLGSVTLSGNHSETVTLPPLTCEAPENLAAEQYYNNVQLTWEAPVSGGNGTWMHWDVQHGNNIGTGGPVDFDIAQRFTPEDLTGQDGKFLTRVVFFPNQPECTYSIRVWTGGNISAPENLVVDQVVANPAIAQWNEVFLNTPVLIDASKELWIGIRNNTTTGHPAGCDVGPAINGKGNMINLAGNGWQTLLEVAPSLDYNWNVRGLVETVGGKEIATLGSLPEGQRASFRGTLSAVADGRSGYEEPRALLGYNLFRNDILLNPSLLTGLSYADNNLANGTYEYNVKALYSNGCTSDYSNTLMVEVTQPDCPAPQNLTGSHSGQSRVTLGWERPPVSGESRWITYSGEQEDAIGTNNVADFDIAQRFTPADFYHLELIEGSLTKVKFFPMYQDCQYSVRVWVGGNATAPGQLVVDQLIPSVTIQTWNEVILTTPVILDPSQELWIGIRCNTNGGRPAGCDAGPAINGKGNMIFWDGAWKTLLDVNPALNYNWCLQGYIDVTEGNQKSVKSLIGYNVYRNGTLLGNTTETEYIDTEAPYGTNLYCVSSVYEVCESQKVCVEVSLHVGLADTDPQGGTIYPNPASDVVNIQLSKDFIRIEIYNQLGSKVFSVDPSRKKLLQLNTAGYPAGNYLVRFVNSEGNTFTKRIVITR